MEGAEHTAHTNTALLQMTLLCASVCALYIQYIHYHITYSENKNLPHKSSYSAFRMLWSLCYSDIHMKQENKITDKSKTEWLSIKS